MQLANVHLGDSPHLMRAFLTSDVHVNGCSLKLLGVQVADVSITFLANLVVSAASAAFLTRIHMHVFQSVESADAPGTLFESQACALPSLPHAQMHLCRYGHFLQRSENEEDKKLGRLWLARANKQVQGFLTPTLTPPGQQSYFS